MSLGVLNNLPALYAENALSRSNSNLSTVLRQLSSGSRINSGADDAAGLSLVNGLQANQQALRQSQTNVQTGVGLLQVADGALSQVTNLLNRAVTLATEAANGTLNTAQGTAANQEYQSILSEISNIGSTTTFNQKAVFGSTVDIYTGDSSVAGASIDRLNIRALSASSVGDTAGAISYTPAVAGSSGSSGPGASTPVTYTAGPGIPSGMNDIYGGGAQLIQIGGISGSDINDVLTGTFSFMDGATLRSYTMGNTYSGTLVNSMATLGQAIYQDDASILVSVWNASGEATLQLNKFPTWDVSFVSDTMQDAAAPIGTGTLSGIGSGDTLSGHVSFVVNGANVDVPITNGYNDTGATLASTMASNTGNEATATYDSATGLVHLVYGRSANPTVTVDASNLIDTTPSTNIPGAPASPAMISYSAAPGQDLSSTNLLNPNQASAALSAISAAIADVAAQDGYIGAQINTLNAIGQVLSTQSENIQAAQNAIQATDYASATSEMAKYQILSQTGIAALAQANSIQQEILKLLQ
jgi:flagellin